MFNLTIVLIYDKIQPKKEWLEMAKRLNEQYDEIFKIVGEKVGLSKLTYEHYKRI